MGCGGSRAAAVDAPTPMPSPQGAQKPAEPAYRAYASYAPNTGTLKRGSTATQLQGRSSITPKQTEATSDAFTSVRTSETPVAPSTSSLANVKDTHVDELSEEEAIVVTQQKPQTAVDDAVESLPETTGADTGAAGIANTDSEAVALSTVSNTDVNVDNEQGENGMGDAPVALSDVTVSAENNVMTDANEKAAEGDNGPSNQIPEIVSNSLPDNATAPTPAASEPSVLSDAATPLPQPIAAASEPSLFSDEAVENTAAPVVESVALADIVDETPAHTLTETNDNAAVSNQQTLDGAQINESIVGEHEKHTSVPDDTVVPVGTDLIVPHDEIAKQESSNVASLEGTSSVSEAAIAVTTTEDDTQAVTALKCEENAPAVVEVANELPQSHDGMISSVEASNTATAVISTQEEARTNDNSPTRPGSTVDTTKDDVADSTGVTNSTSPSKQRPSQSAGRQSVLAITGTGRVHSVVKKTEEQPTLPRLPSGPLSTTAPVNPYANVLKSVKSDKSLDKQFDLSRVEINYSKDAVPTVPVAIAIFQELGNGVKGAKDAEDEGKPVAAVASPKSSREATPTEEPTAVTSSNPTTPTQERIDAAIKPTITESSQPPLKAEPTVPEVVAPAALPSVSTPSTVPNITKKPSFTVENTKQQTVERDAAPRVIPSNKTGVAGRIQALNSGSSAADLKRVNSLDSKRVVSAKSIAGGVKTEVPSIPPIADAASPVLVRTSPREAAGTTTPASAKANDASVPRDASPRTDFPKSLTSTGSSFSMKPHTTTTTPASTSTTTKAVAGGSNASKTPVKITGGSVTVKAAPSLQSVPAPATTTATLGSPVTADLPSGGKKDVLGADDKTKSVAASDAKVSGAITSPPTIDKTELTLSTATTPADGDATAAGVSAKERYLQSLKSSRKLK